MKPQVRQERAQQHWQAGVAQAKRGQWLRAVEEFEQATRLAPSQPLYWINLGRAQLGAGRLEASIDAGRRALALDPRSAIAARLAAEGLLQLHRSHEAVDCFEAVAEDAVRDHDFHAAHGNALFQAGRAQEAIGVFFKALSLKIDSVLVHYRMGLCFMDLGLKEEAAECFRTVAALDDGESRVMALALLVHESRQACRWASLADETAALHEAIAQLRPDDGQLLSPFALLAVDCSPQEQLRVATTRSRSLTRHVVALPPRPLERNGRLRVGYLSSDVYHHATAVLIAELLERRDPARFEVFMYSHSRDDGSPIRQRVIDACDHFIDVTHETHRDTARRIREDRIDVLIDLKGHTRGSRYEVLAWRPAPVQATYLGFPGSTGADFIDYVIGDPVVTPLEHAANFSEHIAQMPWSYQPNDRQRALPPKPSREAVGLPADAVVFCCFNQVYKFSPQMLDLWAQVLRRVPQGVLWILRWNPQAERNLMNEFAARGVGPERIVWGEKLTLESHLARLRCADLFLDTWPCNAHTTASEALWAGVPVLTVPGPTFASRVAASLLRACRLDELVCTDAQAYVEAAVALAQDVPRLRALQAHLDRERLSLPLFDTDRYARDFEALIERMAERAAQGLPPQALPAAP